MATMYRTREELHEAFIKFLGNNNVYFRPPESSKMKYPCIVYDIRSGEAEYANNATYIFHLSYDVQIIHKDPDSHRIEDFLYAFPKARFDRSFKVNNLNHENFILYT